MTLETCEVDSLLSLLIAKVDGKRAYYRYCPDEKSDHIFRGIASPPPF